MYCCRNCRYYLIMYKEKESTEHNSKKEPEIAFNDKFIEAKARLMSQYSSAPVMLKKEMMNEFIEDIKEKNKEVFRHIRNKERNAVSGKEFSLEQILELKKKLDNLISIFMMLFSANKCLEKDNFYDLDNLEELQSVSVMINNHISSMLMDIDYKENDSLDFDGNYLPDIMIVEYVNNIYKTERFLKNTLRVDSICKIELEKEMVELNQKLDKEILRTAYSFIGIQAILLLMESSVVYSDNIHMIAKEILFVFKELLVNARIKRIEIDPAIASNVMRSGFKKTTAIKIYFALENMDRYCLRIDFPHEGEEFLHYNLHEPGRKTGLPLKAYEYKKVEKKYGNLENLFFHFEKSYWFRNDFLSKLEELYPGEENEMLRTEMLRLFHDQAHYHMFTQDIGREDMVEFLAEFACALSHMPFGEFLYSYSDEGDIDEELMKIKLRDILFDALTLYQRSSLEEQVYKCSYKESKIFLKEKLLTALFEHYKSYVQDLGSYEDFYEMDIKEILVLLEEIVHK